MAHHRWDRRTRSGFHLRRLLVATLLVACSAVPVVGVAAEGDEVPVGGEPESAPVTLPDTRPIVVAVELHGVRGTSPEGVASRAGIVINEPLRADRTRKAIKSLYGTGEYRSVEAYIREIGRTPDGRSRVILIFRAFRREIVDAIRFEKNKALSDDILRRAARVTLGRELPDNAVRDITERLEGAYALRGYREALVAVTVRDAAELDHVELVVTMDEGPPTRIRSIKFDGDLPVMPEALIALTDLHPGSVVDETKFRSARDAMRTWFRERTYFDVRLRDPRVVDVPKSPKPPTPPAPREETGQEEGRVQEGRRGPGGPLLPCGDRSPLSHRGRRQCGDLR